MTPEKPVALIHSYWLDQKGRDKPDMYGRLQILAGLELLRQDKISKLVFTAGHKVGGECAIEVIERQVRRDKPTVTEEEVVFIPAALSTRGEVRQFRKTVKERGWNNCIDIAAGWHLPRVKGALRREFGQKSGEILVFTAEEILTKKIPETRSERYQNIVDEMINSPEWQALKKQTDFLDKIEALPGGSFAVEVLTRIFPHNREVLRSWASRISKRR